MDCQVLSQLVADIALQRPESAASILTFESLLPSPHELEALPIAPMRRVDPPSPPRVRALYQRFPNNNHVIQIHLRAIGVAIMPLTSRLLNHSCSPNAVLRYILSASQKPRAEVVTIREISEGEEVRLSSFYRPQRFFFTNKCLTRCRSPISTPQSPTRSDRADLKIRTVLTVCASCAPFRL